MEEVLRDVEPPMRRESDLHSDRTSHRTQFASMRTKCSSSVGTDIVVRFMRNRHTFVWGIIFGVTHGAKHGDQWNLKTFANIDIA